jgi:multidrug efflux pump subunit AcrB
MWLVIAALKRPITVLVLSLAVVLGALLGVERMPRDIFPDLGLPVIYVVQTWSGMTPAQMEGILVSKYEYHFLYIAGIEHIESQSIQGVSIMKLYFHPGTDTSFAMAQVTAMAYRATAFMPPGTVAPFIMRLDAGSYPVAQLVFQSDTRSDTEIQDLALYRVRPILATLPGVSAPPPFGGKVRMVMVDLDPGRLRACSMSPEEVAVALAQSNVTLPEGVVRIGDDQLITTTNAVVKKPSDLNDVPIRVGPGAAVYLRDVGNASDSGDVVTNIAHVNGRRAVYLPVTKRSGASTLGVIEAVKKKLPDMKAAVPADIDVRIEFDQSVYVVHAIEGLVGEGALGAILTGLAVLAFLRDPRSALVVVVSIPISVLMAVLALWLAGQTINIMTLGGLALAVGILVDEATVEIENIHVHLARGKSPALAVLDAMREVRFPRLVAMLCVCAVFLPAFYLVGVGRALFAPLALAVTFAMVSSYLATSTLVPVLAAWVLRPAPHAGDDTGAAAAARAAYGRLVATFVRYRYPVVAVYLAACIALVAVGRGLPAELFPASSGERFQLRIRAPDGTRLERTEQIVLGVLDVVKEEAGPGGLEITLANIGTTPANAPVSAVFVWNGGPHEGILLVSLRPDRRRSLLAFEERLRAALAARFPQVHFSFEAGDVISQVLDTGAPDPVDVVVSGNDLAAVRAHATRIRDELGKVPFLRDLAIPLPLDAPAIGIDIDRVRAGQLGVTTSRVARSLVEATWTSQLTQQVFWIDASGLAYFVAVRLPEGQVASIEDVKNLPVMPDRSSRPLLRDVARVTTTTVPGELDHWNQQRTVSVTANAATDDLLAVSNAVDRAIATAGTPARGITVAVRGQLEQLRATLDGLAKGLGLAVLVVVLLLAANFQSARDAVAILLTVPAVLAGVVVALAATGTSVNIQSFIGAIMAVGVSVANAVLVTKRTQDRRREGVPTGAAAAEAALTRVRAILMTSLAMLAGMLPMALALGEGGEQNAPLGRAVMGGLAASTVATLFVLPAILAIVHGDRRYESASLYAHDPDSKHFVSPEPSRLEP